MTTDQRLLPSERVLQVLRAANRNARTLLAAADRQAGESEAQALAALDEVRIARRDELASRRELLAQQSALIEDALRHLARNLESHASALADASERA